MKPFATIAVLATLVFLCAAVFLMLAIRQSRPVHFRSTSEPPPRRYRVTDTGQSVPSLELTLPSKFDGTTLPAAKPHLVSRNAFGEAVGWALFPGKPSFHACLWKNGKIQDLGTLGGKQSFAYDINASGQVVGYSEISHGIRRACLWQDGKILDLGTLGGESSRAYAINDLGEIVGDADTVEGLTHAFLYKEGKMRDLGTLGGGESSARDINNQGEIVGRADTYVPALMHAFLWSNGAMFDLNSALPPNEDCELMEAWKIAETGAIQVEGDKKGERAYLCLTP